MRDIETEKQIVTTTEVQIQHLEGLNLGDEVLIC